MLALLSALMTLIASLFGKYLGVLLKKLTFKTLIYGIYVLGVLSLVTVLYSLIDLSLQTAASNLDSSVTGIFRSFLPNNTPFVISSVLTMETALVVFNYKKRLLRARTINSANV